MHTDLNTACLFFLKNLKKDQDDCPQIIYPFPNGTPFLRIFFKFLDKKKEILFNLLFEFKNFLLNLSIRNHCYYCMRPELNFTKNYTKKVN
jgi:hypothetical protein